MEWKHRSPISKGLPVSRVSWSTSLLYLIRGKLKLELSIDAEGLEGKSDLLLSNDSVKLSDLKVEINSSFINEVTESWPELSESFTVTTSEIIVSDNWFSQISGKVAWPGGSIGIDTPLERLKGSTTHAQRYSQNGRQRSKAACIQIQRN